LPFFALAVPCRPAMSGDIRVRQMPGQGFRSPSGALQSGPCLAPPRCGYSAAIKERRGRFGTARCVDRPMTRPRAHGQQGGRDGMNILKLALTGGSLALGLAAPVAALA